MPSEAEPAAALRGRLFERRIVLLCGPLDDAATAESAAALMTLDALGDAPIELRLQSAHGGLAPALALLDVMAVIDAAVETSGLGRLAGGAVALLAAGTRRRLAPHAVLHCAWPDEAIGGNAHELARALAALGAQRAAFLAAVARACHRPLAEVAATWDAGRVLEPADACTLGYADAVAAGPGASAAH